MGAAQPQYAVMQQASSNVQPFPPRNKNRSKSFPQQCDSFCGVWAEIRFEWESTKQRLRTMSTWPQYRRSVVQALAHRADRRDCARRGDAPRPSPDGAARPATPNPNRRLSGRKGELALRRAVGAFACGARLSPPTGAVRGTALHARARFALRCRWRQQLGRDVLFTFGPTGGRRRAACTRVSAASCCASFPKCSAYCFSVCLHARGCAVGWLCGAAQRYPLLF